MLRIFLISLLVSVSVVPGVIFSASNSQRVSIVAGSESSASARLARDLELALADSYESVAISTTTNPVDSVKHLQKIGTIDTAVSAAESVVGIVPSDILSYLGATEDESTRGVKDGLRFLLPLHKQRVHLFARRSISDLDDLSGKRVVLGVKESRHWITATNILRIASIEPAESILMDAGEAVRAVLTDQADAMFFVDSLPSDAFSVFENWQEDSQYGKLLKEAHLVPLSSPALLDQYDESMLPAGTYSWFGEAVKTISTTDLLVSIAKPDEDGDRSQQRCDQLQGLADSIRNSVAALNSSKSQLWANVQLDSAVRNWEPDSCLNSGETTIEKNSAFDEKCLMKGECE